MLIADFYLILFEVDTDFSVIACWLLTVAVGVQKAEVATAIVGAVSVDVVDVELKRCAVPRGTLATDSALKPIPLLYEAAEGTQVVDTHLPINYRRARPMHPRPVTLT